MTGNSFPKRGRASPIPAAVPVTKSRGFPRTQTNACSTLPWFSCPFSFLGPLVVTGLWAWCVPELRHAGERAKPAAWSGKFDLFLFHWRWRGAARWHRHRHRSRGARRKLVLHGRGNFVRVFYQHGHLPNLRFRQLALVAVHPRQSNPVFHFPVRLPRIVVRHANAMKELRRRWIHSQRDRALGLTGNPMARSALLLIKLCTRNHVGFIRRYLGLRVRQLI